MKIKRFDQINENIGRSARKYIEEGDEIEEYQEGRKPNFESQKQLVLNKIDELMDKYDDLTIMVSPKHWRTTGSNFMELNKMKEDVEGFTEATEKDKENKFYKEQLEEYLKKKKAL